MSHRMGGFNRRDDALRLCQVFKGADRLLIRHGHIFRAPDVVQVSVLRPHAGIVQSGGNGIHGRDLAIFVLAEPGFHPVKNTHPARIHGGGRFKGIDSSSRRFRADQPHRRIVNEMIEAADGVGASAHAGDHRVGKPSLLFHELLFDFLRDHRLKIPHDGGERVRPHHRTEAVVGVADPGGPLAHGFRNRVLQRGSPGPYRDDFGSEQTHAVDIEGLPPGILLSHENHALHSHQRCRRGRCHPVLACARFRDQTGLSHFFCKKRLSQHVVDLVRAGMVQILPFEIDFRAAKILRHFFRKIEPRRPSRIFVKKCCEFPVKFRIVFISVIGFFQLDHRIHQRLRNVLPSVDAEPSIWICHTSSFPRPNGRI